MIIAGLATLPERWEHLPRVLEHVLPNVDRLYVYVDRAFSLSGIPDVLYEPNVRWVYSEDRLGDAGKFLARHHFGSAYFLTLDDDLFYPATYVQDMCREVDFYDKRAVVSYHGGVISGPVTSYYHGGRNPRFQCTADDDSRAQVNVAGTGCMAFHTSVVKPDPDDFKSPNMADIWFALYCQREQIPQFVVPHKALEHAPIDLNQTIWAREHQRDDRQTAAVNAHSPWTLPPCELS